MTNRKVRNIFSRWTSDACVVVGSTSVFKHMPTSHVARSTSNLSHRKGLLPIARTYL